MVNSSFAVSVLLCARHALIVCCTDWTQRGGQGRRCGRGGRGGKERGKQLGWGGG